MCRLWPSVAAFSWQLAAFCSAPLECQTGGRGAVIWGGRRGRWAVGAVRGDGNYCRRKLSSVWPWHCRSAWDSGKRKERMELQSPGNCFKMHFQLGIIWDSSAYICPCDLPLLSPQPMMCENISIWTWCTLRPRDLIRLILELVKANSIHIVFKEWLEYFP